jgi:signal transduction histidine kinase
LIDSDLATHIKRITDLLESDESSGNILQRLFETVLNSAMQITEAEEGAVLSVDHDRAQLRIEAWKGPGVDKKSRIIVAGPKDSVCAWTVTHAKPALVPDVRGDDRFLSMSSSTVCSELAVPALSRGKPIGVVNLESFEPRHFTQAHMERIRDFCAALSPYWELASFLDWRTRITRQEQAFSRINGALIDGSPATLNAIKEALLALVPAQVADILLLDAEGENLWPIAAESLREEHQDKPIRCDQGIVGRCVRQGTIQNVPDVSKDGDYIHITKKKMGSMLAAPLIYKGRTIGVINMEGENLNQFSFEDIRLVKLFAEQATIAVINSKIISQYWASEALASLGTMTGNLAHRMNNIVGGIRVLSGFLANDLETKSPELVPQARQIELTAKDALNVVEQYEQKFRHTDDTIDLHNLISELIDQIKHPPNVRIAIAAPDTPVLLVDSRPQVTELFAELIRNAIKSVGESGTVEIRIAETSGAVKVEVKDNGKGLTEENRSRIFERGYKAREDSTGMGFGLWWIKNFVESRGGQIKTLDAEGGGAIFQVVYPKVKSVGRKVEGGSHGTT